MSHSSPKPSRYARLREYSTLIPYLLSIIVFAFGVISAELPTAIEEDTRKLIEAFIWGLSALLAGIIGDKLVGFATERDRETAIQGALSDIEDAIANETIQRVGSGDEVLPQLEESVSKASHVRNTFLNVGGAPEGGSSQEARILQIYEKFLLSAKSEIWRDIISVNELFNFRHLHLFSQRAKAAANPQSKAIFPKLPAVHNIAILRRSMPIINFIVLENKTTNFREVYFGWIFDASRTSTMIYKSTNPDVIDVFDKYFEVLWCEQKAEEWAVNYDAAKEKRGPKRKFIVDKAGLWLTATYDPTNGKLIDRAIVSIEFDEREPIVRGVILRDGAITPPFEYKTAMEAPNTLVWPFSNPTRRDMRSGYCVYNFSTKGGVPVIRGHLLPIPDDFQRAAPSRLLFAIRYPEMDAEDREEDRLDPLNDAKKMIERAQARFDDFWASEIRAMEPPAVIANPEGMQSPSG